MKPFLKIVLTASCLLSAGCSGIPGGQDAAEAFRLADDPDFSAKHLNTPARYFVEQMEFERVCIRLLQDRVKKNYYWCIPRVAALYRNIRKGLEWKRENAVFKIPFLTHPPEIDGIVLENEWRDALEFREEYPLDSATPLSERNSRWRIGYDRNCLYFSAQFEDSDIVAWNTVGKYGLKNKAIYEADCFEVFLRPSPAFQHYYEFLTNPEGTSWDMMHCHLKTGRWQPINDRLNLGILRAASIENGKLNYEMAIPLAALYGEWNLRGIRPGDEFEFMPIRCDRNASGFRKTTPVPLLYDGHNIYGYIRGVFQ